MAKTPSLKAGEMFDLYWTDNFLIQGETKETGELFLHTGWFKGWSKQIYKDVLLGLITIKETARAKGHERIYVFIQGDNPKLLKFEMMLGFDADAAFKDQNGQTYILMSQGTE